MTVRREFRPKPLLQRLNVREIDLTREASASSLLSVAGLCNVDQAGDAVSGDPPPTFVTPKNGS